MVFAWIPLSLLVVHHSQLEQHTDLDGKKPKILGSTFESSLCVPAGDYSSRWITSLPRKSIVAVDDATVKQHVVPTRKWNQTIKQLKDPLPKLLNVKQKYIFLCD